VAREWLHCTPREAMERLSSEEFAEIWADYGLEPWGNEWERTAYLASALAISKSGQSIKDHKALIPRIFPYTFEINTNEIDTESFFRGLTSGDNRTPGN
jgi:hypothetical protein